MTEPKPSFTKRMFSGLWNLLNFSRKLFFNVIFIAIIVAIIAGISSGDKEFSMPKSAALVLKLSGDLVEQKRSVDPMEEFIQELSDSPDDKPEVLLSDVLLAIDNAKHDNRIKALVLDLQGLGRAGLNKLQTIGTALDGFKESEKPIYAVADFYSQNQYFLASYADKIYLHPMGGVMLEGYGRYRLYYKSAIEKLKATAHIFRVGTYKSAIEPYMRDDMSDAAKVSNQEWLSSLWSHYKQSVAARRDMSLDNFDESLDSLLVKLKESDGDWAAFALANGWVDELKDREAVRQELSSVVGENFSGNSYSRVSFKNYLKVVKPPFPISNPSTDKVAVVVAKGTIKDGNKAAGEIGGDSTAKLLRKARLDDKVKAVVLRVDSPGGSAFASEVIRHEIESLKAAGKPVVASMSTYAASGGYWISASADEIWASPSTITGSIGIFGMFLTFENTLASLGVHNDGVGTTELAGFGVTRALSPKLADVIQLSIEQGYKKFITLVSNERNMSVEQVNEIAQGRVWIGSKAKELGLVDNLGTLQDAIASAAKLANLERYDTKLIERSLSPKEKFLKEFFGAATAMVKTDQVTDANPSDIMKLVKQVLLELDSTSKLNDPMGMHAFCLTCEI